MSEIYTKQQADAQASEIGGRIKANSRAIRVTRAQINQLVNSASIIPDRLYLIADEDRLAIGLSTAAYESFSREGEGGGTTADPPASVAQASAIAQGATLGLEQALLASAGQPGLTVLAVGYTTSGKVQGVSLGAGNVVEVYASGADFNAGAVLYREFLGFGEPICFTGCFFWCSRYWYWPWSAENCFQLSFWDYSAFRQVD